MYLKNILILYCVTHIIVIGNMLPGKVQNKFDTMKNRIANLLKADKGLPLYIDINELEFPGANNTLKEMHKVMWNEYYDCLKKQYIEAGSKRILHPLTLTAMVRTSITLRCTICISPNEMHTIESIDWFYSSVPHTKPLNSLLQITEHTVISANDRALTLHNVEKKQEGLYWCKLETMLSTPYYLFIANETEPIINVRPNDAPSAQHSVAPIIVEKLGLKIYSSWTPWTSCSMCRTVGKRMRYGFCTISLIDYPIELFIESGQTRGTLKRLLHNVMNIFGNKLPCRSWYTPKDIEKIPEVKNRSSEIMTSFCKVKCQENVIFEVRDSNGRVLESANNSAGIYSFLQGKPNPPPSIVRVTQYSIHGTRKEIKCPGNLNTDVPIVWQLGSKILNPRQIEQQTHGRVFIDSYQRIILKELRYADANIYSCWQRNQLAGTVRLIVTYELTSEIGELNHRVFMFLGIPIVSMLLWVYWRAFRGRRRYTKR